MCPTAPRFCAMNRKERKKSRRLIFAQDRQWDYIDHVGEREKKKRNQAKENSLEKNKQNTKPLWQKRRRTVKNKKKKNTSPDGNNRYDEQDGAR